MKAALAEDQKYVKRLRERMRYRGYLLTEVWRVQTKVWEWWWIRRGPERRDFGPYQEAPEAFIAAESLLAGGLS